MLYFKDNLIAKTKLILTRTKIKDRKEVKKI